MKTNLILISMILLSVLAGCAPAAPVSSGDGIVRAVLFWTPGCLACETALTQILPPLEKKYGARLVITKVPLNNVAEVDQLYAAADFFKMKKDDVLPPFLVIGADALSGEAALRESLDAKIAAGFKAGGLAAPALPATLSQLAARATPTPRATLPPITSGPGQGTIKPTDPSECVINTPCAPTVTPAK
jgi:thiol-disulfide isomerase/thioredoxin